MPRYPLTITDGVLKLAEPIKWAKGLLPLTVTDGVLKPSISVIEYSKNPIFNRNRWCIETWMSTMPTLLQFPLTVTDGVLKFVSQHIF